MEEPEYRGGSYNKTSRNDLSSWMFYIMILLAVSLPLSEFGMSVAQFLLLFIWVFEGANFKTEENKRNKAISFIQAIGRNVTGKFRCAGRNHLLLVFIALYFIHVIGLLYSTDLQYGLKDIRVKLPLLSIPVLLATSTALNRQRLNILLLFFVLAVISGSFISTYVYLTREISDIREISIFISHIRFSLFISLSIFILLGFIKYNAFGNKLKIGFALGAFWLVIFLFILKSFTGLMITALMFVVVLLIQIIQRRKLVIAAAIAAVLIAISGWWYVNDVYKSITVAEPLNYTALDKTTKLGNPYTHDTVAFGIEHGSYVGMYLALDELRQAWNGRSELDFDGHDHKGQDLKYTLIRFLHSKGFRKDAMGVQNLTSEEVTLIENGLANAGSVNKLSLRPYLEAMLMGYKTYRVDKNPNGSSLMQRIEYWKTSVHLIKERPVTGHGTGDVETAFEKAYNETNSPLWPEFRHRSHNQFLAITIALGFIGLIVFMTSMFYPPLQSGKFNNYYYLVFFIIVFVSFITEDTLETQAGATFFAFFNAVLLFGVRRDVDEHAAVLSNKQ